MELEEIPLELKRDLRCKVRMRYIESKGKSKLNQVDRKSPTLTRKMNVQNDGVNETTAEKVIGQVGIHEKAVQIRVS